MTVSIIYSCEMHFSDDSKHCILRKRVLHKSGVLERCFSRRECVNRIMIVEDVPKRRFRRFRHSLNGIRSRKWCSKNGQWSDVELSVLHERAKRRFAIMQRSRAARGRERLSALCRGTSRLSFRTRALRAAVAFEEPQRALD